MLDIPPGRTGVPARIERQAELGSVLRIYLEGSEHADWLVARWSGPSSKVDELFDFSYLVRYQPVR